MVVKICIGSSCHTKGSYNIVQYLISAVKKDGLENKIELKSSFCLGHCSRGVSVQIDDDPVSSVSLDEIESYYTQKIKACVK